MCGHRILWLLLVLGPNSLWIPVSFCHLCGMMYAGELFPSPLLVSHHTAALCGDTLDSSMEQRCRSSSRPVSASLLSKVSMPQA